MIDVILQTILFVLGVTAIYLVSKKNRWGFVIGLASQPLWLYISYTTAQWGIFFMSIVYAFTWANGIRTWFALPQKVHHPHVKAIFVAASAGAPMEKVDQIEVIKGLGLEGDRYAAGDGSYNQGNQGKRQITFVNGKFFPDSGFTYEESRRNIVTLGVELYRLIGREFQIGEARFKGIKYCDVCTRPSSLTRKRQSFKIVFEDCGGIVAEVLHGGLICENDTIILPPKKY